MRWQLRAMTQWKTLDGGVTNLIVAVCLSSMRDFRQLIQEGEGEADEISFALGFQEYQQLLAAGWQMGRRCSGPRMTFISGEYDPNAKNEVWLQTAVICRMVLYLLSVRREARFWGEDTCNGWMLREGEVYDLGGVQVPHEEEPRP